MKINKQEFTKRLGKRIQEVRKANGWHKAYMFAEVADIHCKTLYTIEEGYRSPSVYTLAKIVKALNVSVQELLEGVV